MSQPVRYQLWIVAVAGAIFFTHLGAAALWDMDEALYTTCAREMFQRGDWIVPQFNGEIFYEKPVLMFWTMMAGFELFGVNEWGARFFSAVLGMSTALTAFHLGRILFNPRVGLWAGLVTASTIVFTISARAATVDSALTFVTTLAFLFFVLGWGRRNGLPSPFGRGVGGEGPSADAAQHPPSPPFDPALTLALSQRERGPAPALSQRERGPAQTLPKRERGVALKLPYAILMYGCLGLAALGKGPVGVVLPLAAMGLFLLVRDGWRNLFRSAWRMRPLTGIVVLAVVAGSWYFEVGRRTGWEWPRQFLLEFNLRPFQKPILGHGDVSSFQRVGAVLVSVLYYFYQVPAVLIGFFPWSVFLGPTLVETVRQLRRKAAKTTSAPGAPDAEKTPDPFSGALLASCWFGVWFVFWSVCKTKLPHYLLPAYPALALLTAWWIDRWLTAAEKGTGPIGAQHPSGRPGKWDPSPFPPPWALRNAWISTILAGVGIVVAVPIVAAYYLPGEWPIGLTGLILIVSGGLCWRLARQKPQRALMIFTAGSVAFLTVALGFAALRVDRFQNARPMIAAIRADEEKGSGVFSPIATYQFFRESTVYYAGYPVTTCDDTPGRSARQALAQFLADAANGTAPALETVNGTVPFSLTRKWGQSRESGQSPSKRSYVVTTNEYTREIEEAFPGEFHEIFRQQRFLSPGEMVVLRHGE
jgi:4-amino-4-deoxy-L-arabinose transferase-like glycosyltransferase